MKTISKNRKSLIEAIFNTAHEAQSFSLENGFSDLDVPLQVVRDALARPGVKLKACIKLVAGIEVQTFHVTIHSNHWYEFVSDTKV